MKNGVNSLRGEMTAKVRSQSCLVLCVILDFWIHLLRFDTLSMDWFSDMILRPAQSLEMKEFFDDCVITAQRKIMEVRDLECAKQLETEMTDERFAEEMLRAEAQERLGI